MNKILILQQKNMLRTIDMKKQWVSEKTVEKAIKAVKNTSDYKQLTAVVFKPEFQAIFR